jgi:hypothetical protein
MFRKLWRQFYAEISIRLMHHRRNIPVPVCDVFSPLRTMQNLPIRQTSLNNRFMAAERTNTVDGTLPLRKSLDRNKLGELASVNQIIIKTLVNPGTITCKNISRGRVRGMNYYGSADNVNVLLDYQSCLRKQY